MTRLRRWTPKEDEQLLCLYGRYTSACIAVFLGRTQGAVWTRYSFLRRRIRR
jgi:hypothetical protein